MQYPTTIPELLVRIETEHERLIQTFAHLSDEEMAAPRLHGGWSVKDTLAHLTFWERRMQYGLRSLAEGGTDRTRVPPEIADIPYNESWVDEVNERVFQHNRDRSLADVRAEFDQSFQQVLARIRSFAPEDIFASEDALDLIADNTYEHYPDHAESIRRVFA